MFSFKYHSCIIFLETEQLITDFKALVNITELAIFFNQLDEKPYKLTKREKNSLDSFLNLLIRKGFLSLIKDNFLVTPKAKFLSIPSFYSVKTSLSKKQFKDKATKDFDEFNGKLKQFFRIKDYLKSPPKDYVPCFHEDYVYSNDNWSHKDASL